MKHLHSLAAGATVLVAAAFLVVAALVHGAAAPLQRQGGAGAAVSAYRSGTPGLEASRHDPGALASPEASRHDRGAPASSRHDDGAVASEITRLRAHFQAVERELLARDVAHLAPEQRAMRARHIEVLREYAAAGVFPHNHDFPGRRVPYFVDEHGTLCAMAYLIHRSGNEALVRRVAATRNHALIPELAEDPELVAWLEAAGLSVEEAARIQPAYQPQPPRASRPRISPRWGAASMATSWLGVTTMVLNLEAEPAAGDARWPGAVGVVAGIAGVAVGMERIGDGGVPTALGAATAGVAIASLGVGTWRLLGAPRGQAGEGSAARRVSVGAAPMVDSESGRAGLLLSARF